MVLIPDRVIIILAFHESIASRVYLYPAKLLVTFIQITMVIVTLGGGLGNQLFQYTIGRQLALKNNTSLRLFINNIHKEEGRTYKLHHFNIEENFATEDEVEKLIGNYYDDTFSAKISKKINQYLPKHKRSYYIEDEYYVYEDELMKISKDVLVEGFWQHHKYYSNLPKSILNEITIREQYVTTSPGFVKNILGDEASVSVHIRRGDYISDPYNLSFFGVQPIQYYNKAISYMVSKVKNACFYVFSDDLNWAEDNLKADSPITFVDIEGGTKDFLELDAMCKCRHNIIANSSFSWWAAFLNKNENKIVIAPKRWVHNEKMNGKVEIQMPDWIKM